jgi:hypothetical protein
MAPFAELKETLVLKCRWWSSGRRTPDAADRDLTYPTMPVEPGFPTAETTAEPAPADDNTSPNTIPPLSLRWKPQLDPGTAFPDKNDANDARTDHHRMRRPAAGGCTSGIRSGEEAGP